MVYFSHFLKITIEQPEIQQLGENYFKLKKIRLIWLTNEQFRSIWNALLMLKQFFVIGDSILGNL